MSPGNTGQVRIWRS